MFRVDVESVEQYFDFDAARKADLLGFDALMTQAVPQFGRYFHAGTPAGQPGRRFKMIGYGKAWDAGGVEWPRVGVALQKNYISVYVMDAEALMPFRGRLGELRMGPMGNFSFVRFADLIPAGVTAMVQEVARRAG